MEPPSEATEEKREQIYQAAIAEFQDKGFREASMDRISARACASKRTVYKYFESKEKLFQEMMHRHWARFAEILSVSYEKDKDIKDQLTALGRAEGRLLTDPKVMAMTRLVMSEVLRSPELVGENQKKTDLKTSFETMLRAADAHGALNVKDPKLAAEEFMALIKGKAFWPVVFGAAVVTPAEMDKIIDSSVAMIMSRYGV